VRRFQLMLVAFLATALLINQAALAQVRTDHSQVGLVAEITSIAPGQTFDVALYLNPDPGWHIYWINAGDAGFPTEVEWDLPEGFEVGDFQFPAPHFVPFMNLMSYGYDGPTFFIAQVAASGDLEDEVVLSGKAEWLACDDQICVPEDAVVELRIPKGDGEEFSVWRKDFANTRAQHPIKMDWNTSFTSTDDRVIFDVELPQGFPELSNLWLFPGVQKLIDHAAPQTINVSDQRLRLKW